MRSQPYHGVRNEDRERSRDIHPVDGCLPRAQGAPLFLESGSSWSTLELPRTKLGRRPEWEGQAAAYSRRWTRAPPGQTIPADAPKDGGEGLWAAFGLGVATARAAGVRAKRGEGTSVFQ